MTYQTTIQTECPDLPNLTGAGDSFLEVSLSITCRSNRDSATYEIDGIWHLDDKRGVDESELTTRELEKINREAQAEADRCAGFAVEAYREAKSEHFNNLMKDE